MFLPPNINEILEEVFRRLSGHPELNRHSALTGLLMRFKPSALRKASDIWKAVIQGLRGQARIKIFVREIAEIIMTKRRLLGNHRPPSLLLFVSSVFQEVLAGIAHRFGCAFVPIGPAMRPVFFHEVFSKDMVRNWTLPIEDDVPMSAALHRAVFAYDEIPNGEPVSAEILEVFLHIGVSQHSSPNMIDIACCLILPISQGDDMRG